MLDVIWSIAGESLPPGNFTISKDFTQTLSVATITKTLKGWEKRKMEWQERAKKTQRAFRQLPEAKLRQFLAERYEEIMDLREMRTESTLAITSNLCLAIIALITSWKYSPANVALIAYRQLSRSE